MPTINDTLLALDHRDGGGIQAVRSHKARQTMLGADPLDALRTVDAFLRLNGTVKIALTRPRLTIGQSKQCDIVLQDRSLEPVHAQVRWRFGRFVLLSDHTMTVNGAATNEHVLRPGDDIMLADVPLIYSERCINGV